jgi:hypothetical protein
MNMELLLLACLTYKEKAARLTPVDHRGLVSIGVGQPSTAV